MTETTRTTEAAEAAEQTETAEQTESAEQIASAEKTESAEQTDGAEQTQGAEAETADSPTVDIPVAESTGTEEARQAARLSREAPQPDDPDAAERTTKQWYVRVGPGRGARGDPRFAAGT